MGAGRSRSIIKNVEVWVDDPNEIEVKVDLDFDTIDALADRYIKEFNRFSMSALGLSDYLEDQNIPVSWGWDLIEDEGELDSDFTDDFSKPKFKVINDDLRYAVYTSVKAVATIKQAYEKATGGKLYIRSLQFEEDIDNNDPGIRGRQTDISSETSEGDYVVSSYIEISVSKGNRLNKDSAQRFFEKGIGSLDLHDEKDKSFFTEYGGRTWGWLAVKGGFSESVTAHEMGHAVLTAMKDTFGRNLGMTKIRSLVTDKKCYDDPVSGYSRKNYDEAFAECFTLYVYGGSSNSEMYKRFCSIMKDNHMESMFGCLK